MRVLIGPDTEDLEALYAPPADDWFRVNFVASVDGAATGADGRSGSINNPVDKRVFDVLRRLSDAVVVGAGTLRIEGYRPLDRPLVVVSGRGDVPERLRDADNVLLATCASAEGLGSARLLLGDERVLVTGEKEVDLVAMRHLLAARGLRHLLSEGGPTLFGTLLDAGVVDELDLTWSPLLVGGAGPGIIRHAGLAVPLVPHVLLEEDGTVLGRWLVTHSR